MISSVVDAFMFSHELDLLEVRLRVLCDHVDKFVIMESDHTHMNKPKPLHFELNKDRYAWAADKIIHKIVFGPLKGNHEARNDFYVENLMRQKLYDFTKSTQQDEGDIMMLSDLDEIPSREGIAHLRKNTFIEPLLFKQDLYYYNITCPMNKKWDGTIACRFSYKIPSAKMLRQNRKNLQPLEEGWHFSYFMSPQDIVTKLQSFAHAGAYGIGDFVREELIAEHIRAQTSLLGKKKGEEQPRPIPEYLLMELEKFPVFMGGA